MSLRAGNRVPSRGRGRIVARSRGRGGASGWVLGSRAMVPATYVPEELVSQVRLCTLHLNCLNLTGCYPNYFVFNVIK